MALEKTLSPSTDQEVRIYALCLIPELIGSLTIDGMQNMPTTVPRKNKWTIVHSHFVLMGGYEVLSDSENQNFLPRTMTLDEPRKGLRLTPAGFQALAEKYPHLIPDQSRESVEDKSKGDAIAKALVCFQGMF